MNKIERFKFKNFEERHKNVLIEFHWDRVFKDFRDRWNTTEYLEYTIKIFKNVCVNNYSTQDFLDECMDIYEVEYGLYPNNKVTKKVFMKIAQDIENIRQENNWNRVKGYFVENIVNYIFLKKFNMKFFVEPEILYKNDVLVYRNDNVARKNFDILAHKKRELFILGEVKTNLVNCISKNDLKLEYIAQINKINDIEYYIINSKKRFKITPKVIKWYIVLNTINGINLPSLNGYKLVEVNDLLANTVFN